MKRRVKRDFVGSEFFQVDLFHASDNDDEDEEEDNMMSSETLSDEHTNGYTKRVIMQREWDSDSKKQVDGDNNIFAEMTTQDLLAFDIEDEEEDEEEEEEEEEANRRTRQENASPVKKITMKMKQYLYKLSRIARRMYRWSSPHHSSMLFVCSLILFILSIVSWRRYILNLKTRKNRKNLPYQDAVETMI